VEGFKLSKDPLFIEKVRDIVGLYVAPPYRALVLCVDEKAQIQALDRSQPLLPMRPGQAVTTIMQWTEQQHAQNNAARPARRSFRSHIRGRAGYFCLDDSIVLLDYPQLDSIPTSLSERA
jgi:hypothetical protein